MTPRGTFDPFNAALRRPACAEAAGDNERGASTALAVEPCKRPIVWLGGVGPLTVGCPHRAVRHTYAAPAVKKLRLRTLRDVERVAAPRRRS